MTEVASPTAGTQLGYDVVAIGMRDYYQVALALQEAGRLGKLITDFYTPDQLRSKVGKRWTEALSSKATRSIWPTALLSKLLTATKFNRARMTFVDDLFGFVAGAFTYLGCNRAVVYSYFLHGFVSFYRLIGKRPTDLVCFQVHPSPWFINRLMSQDAEAFEPIARVSFLEDIEAAFTEKDMTNYRRALSYCRKVVCASSVSRRSIADATDIDIDVVPYGSKIESFSTGASCDEWANDGRIRLLSVCQLVQRKGMHWAFAAMAQLDPALQSKFEWIVVANFVDPQIAALAPHNVRFLTGLSDEMLSALMGSADLFLMPSILEGFGLVYIEALSAGTPVVYTDNTGPADFCTEGQHGMCVAYSSIDGPTTLFQSVLANPDALAAMRPACTSKARELTWPAFRAAIRSSILGVA